jgi:hypothetical protein
MQLEINPSTLMFGQFSDRAPAEFSIPQIKICVGVLLIKVAPSAHHEVPAHRRRPSSPASFPFGASLASDPNSAFATAPTATLDPM